MGSYRAEERSDPPDDRRLIRLSGIALLPRSVTTAARLGRRQQRTTRAAG